MRYLNQTSPVGWSRREAVYVQQAWKLALCISLDSEKKLRLVFSRA